LLLAGHTIRTAAHKQVTAIRTTPKMMILRPLQHLKTMITPKFKGHDNTQEKSKGQYNGKAILQLHSREAQCMDLTACVGLCLCESHTVCVDLTD